MSKKPVNRVFLIVLDSFGIGHAPDADRFGDEGSNTLASIAASSEFHTPVLQELGLFNIDGVEAKPAAAHPQAAYGRLFEASNGKDTTIGHWEIAGIVSPTPLPTYPDGFPQDILDAFSRATGRGVLCNKPYSGTDVIRDYGEKHLQTGDLIVYTSADSVFQIAAHEDLVPPEQLYEYCRIAREILTGEHAVGRVIARPFNGEAPEFKRTSNRHDFSLDAPKDTVLDYLHAAGLDTLAVGKINDIFVGRGISKSYTTKNNTEGMERTIALMDEDFRGLCFVNLVDFDMLYGHRNNIDGYAAAATAADRQLGEFIGKMREDDVLIITADHGCDPGFPGTDHSREAVPCLVYGKPVKAGTNLGSRTSYAWIAASILDMFAVSGETDGESFWPEIAQGGL